MRCCRTWCDAPTTCSDLRATCPPTRTRPCDWCVGSVLPCASISHGESLCLQRHYEPRGEAHDLHTDWCVAASSASRVSTELKCWLHRYSQRGRVHNETAGHSHVTEQDNHIVVTVMLYMTCVPTLRRTLLHFNICLVLLVCSQGRRGRRRDVVPVRGAAVLRAPQSRHAADVVQLRARRQRGPQGARC